MLDNLNLAASFGFAGREVAAIERLAAAVGIPFSAAVNFSYGYSAGNDGSLRGVIGAYRNAHRAYA